MTLKICYSNNVELPKAWNQINWERVFSEVETLRENIFTCMKSENLMKLSEFQKQILVSPATMLLAIRRIMSKSATETAGVDEQIIINDSDKWNIFNEFLDMDLAHFKNLRFLNQKPKVFEGNFLQFEEFIFLKLIKNDEDR